MLNTLAPRRILVQGHRGARARLPENTLPAFEYAIAQNVDAIEMDLAVTRDNIIVISHDPTLVDAAIHRLTLDEVRQSDCGMPTLDDVFGLAVRGTFDYNLEIKSFPDQPEYAPPPEEFARMVLQKIRRYNLEKRVIVQSFDFRTLVAMRAIAPEIRLSALVENDARDFAAIAAEAGNAEIVAPDFHLVTPDKVAAAHRAGLQVISWTANTPAEWEPLIQASVDGIISDDPAELIAYLKKSGLIAGTPRSRSSF